MSLFTEEEKRRHAEAKRLVSSAPELLEAAESALQFVYKQPLDGADDDLWKLYFKLTSVIGKIRRGES